MREKKLKKIKISIEIEKKLLHYESVLKLYKKSKEIGENIARKVGTLILTGPTSEKIENATRIALDEINEGKDKRDIEIIHTSNLEESVKMAKISAKPGDIVLLSPASASFDAFKNFMERGKKFKDFVNELK